MTAKLHWGDSDTLMDCLCGSQILNGRIEEDGLYLTFADQRVLVVVCLPDECLGLTLLTPEGTLQ